MHMQEQIVTIKHEDVHTLVFNFIYEHKKNFVLSHFSAPTVFVCILAGNKCHGEANEPHNICKV